MEILTHKKAAPLLLGSPVRVESGKRAEVELLTSEEMAVDSYGLVHGGFTYGLADYTAMLTVNHPFVVLGKSESRFIAPVRVGDLMKAVGRVTEEEGGKKTVTVDVQVEGKKVFTGVFTCYALEKHVLFESNS